MEWILAVVAGAYLLYLSIALGRANAQIRELDRQLRNFRERHVEVASDADSDGGKFAALAVLATFVILALAVLYVVWHYGHPQAAVAFEFGSYVFPGLAASIAGLGLYWRRRESTYFVTASACVLLGFVCFVCSKAEDFTKLVAGTSVIEGIFALTASGSMVIFGAILITKNAALYRKGAILTCGECWQKWGYLTLLVGSVVLFVYRLKWIGSVLWM